MLFASIGITSMAEQLRTSNRHGMFLSGWPWLAARLSHRVGGLVSRVPGPAAGRWRR
jgi:hypothetical protein